MSKEDSNARYRELQEHRERTGEPLGWFEDLYRLQRDGEENVPWLRDAPNAELVKWAESNTVPPGGEACVIGCGLGNDAAYLASRGWHTVAFDIAPTALTLARERHPQAPVEWVVADLTQLPGTLTGRFDFVFEANTLQAIPAGLRALAFPCAFQLLKPGGALLLVARARDASQPADGPPWPLTREELIPPAGFIEESLSEILAGDNPSDRRWRILYRRPA